MVHGLLVFSKPVCMREMTKSYSMVSCMVSCFKAYDRMIDRREMFFSACFASVSKFMMDLFF